ncbi:MAG: IS5 family transposase ISBam3 [Burkholderia gladioli]|nr:MAG: IS5 family transposase ISBam3 [Burkholderia gladioli]
MHKTGETKARYRVRNWAAYNEGQINLGNMTIWIDEAVLSRMPDAIPTRGRPRLYGDTLIQALLAVKTVYRLTLRALQGFTQSLRDLAFPSLLVPHYTTLCFRAKTLDVELQILCDNEPDPSGSRQHRSEGLWRR